MNITDLILTSDVPIILTNDDGDYYELEYKGLLSSGLDDSPIALLISKKKKINPNELYEK